MLQPIDAALLRWIIALPHPTALTHVMSAVSILGISGAVWIAIAFVYALREDGKALMGAWRVVTAVWLALLLANWVFKPMIDRPRPFRADPAFVVAGAYQSSSPSFPSGHAASAAAGAYALSLLWPHRRRTFWALAALMMFTRVYLGVHYPSDVVVGALVGWAAAVFATAKTPCYSSGSLPRSA